MQSIVNYLDNFWHSLPHFIQALIVAFSSAALASLGKHLSDPEACWKIICLKQYVGLALGSGVSAVTAFYMRPGPGAAGRQ